MKDETLGIKTNRVMLNLAQCNGVEAPEPGIAPVIIDGNPIHAVHQLVLLAGHDRMTTLTITFECEVSGQIAGASIADMLKGKPE